MNENLVLFGKISARSFLGWLKIVVIGTLVSGIALIISILLLSNNSGPGFAGTRAGGFGAVLGILMLFVVEFWTAFLFLCASVCLVLYIPLASKYVIGTAVHLVWEKKLASFFEVRVSSYLDRFFDNRSSLSAQTAAGRGLVKQELKEAVNADGETNRLQKRILNYVLKRLRLDNIDFLAPPAEIKNAVVRKVREVISEKVKPSLSFFWMLIVVQIVVLILALIFDHH